MINHVLFLLFGYYPMDPRVRRQAEAMRDAGWKVSVISTSSTGQRQTASVDGVRLETIPLVKSRRTLGHYLRQYIAATYAFRKMINAMAASGNVPDVIVVATLPDFLVFSATAARQLGTRVVLDFHEAAPEFFTSKFGAVGGLMVRRWLTWLELASAANADAWMTVNDVIADRFCYRIGVRPLVIYNSPDERIFGPVKPPSRDRQKTGVIFGYHGTFTKIYGLDLLLTACFQLKSGGATFRVRLIGDGPEAGRLRQMVENLGLGRTVEFVDPVPLEEIRSVVEGIDIGVVPTRKDEFLDMSLGTKLLEYVHLGKPVVASNLTAVRRIFGDDNSLYYFEGNSARDLERVMRMALREDPVERGARVKTAQRLYSPIVWERMSRKMVEELEGLVAGGRGK